MYNGLNMDIQAVGEPHPGQVFNFTVRGGSGTARIAAYLNGIQVLQSECPDPPCHEMVFVPTNAFGQLMIVATDSSGVAQQRVFAIQKATSGGGMVSST
jgi:hypothetical protein